MTDSPRRFFVSDPAPTTGHSVLESMRESTATVLLPMTVPSIGDESGSETLTAAIVGSDELGGGKLRAAAQVVTEKGDQ